MQHSKVFEITLVSTLSELWRRCALMKRFTEVKRLLEKQLSAKFDGTQLKFANGSLILAVGAFSNPSPKSPLN